MKKKSHVLPVITFFSSLIILCLLGAIFFIPMKSPTMYRSSLTSVPLHNPISVSRAGDLQTIQNASSSGSIACTTEDPGICQKNEEGNVLEYTVGCTGKIPSASIYICKKGRWEYIDWTNYSQCHTCAGK